MSQEYEVVKNENTRIGILQAIASRLKSIRNEAAHASDGPEFHDTPHADILENARRRLAAIESEIPWLKADISKGHELIRPLGKFSVKKVWHEDARPFDKSVAWEEIVEDQENVGYQIREAVGGSSSYEYYDDRLIKTLTAEAEANEPFDSSFYHGEGVYHIDQAIPEKVWEPGQVCVDLGNFSMFIEKVQ